MATIRVDVTKVIADYEGKPLKTQERKIDVVDGKPVERIDEVELTYRNVIHNALHYVAPVKGQNGQDQPGVQTGEQKAKVYRMATKLWGARPMFKVAGDEQNFIIEQIIAVGYGPLIWGRIKELFGEPLEGTSNDERGESKGVENGGLHGGRATSASEERTS